MARDAIARTIVKGLAVKPIAGRRRSVAGRRRRITFVAVYAYATGGVPRAVFSVANELAARGHEVEVVSVLRSRPAPYVDIHPAVTVSYLEDRVNPDPTARILPRARRNPDRHWLVRYLDRQPTQLADDAYPALSALTDAQLARKLRSLPPGIVVTTRPELAVAAVRWAPPDVIIVEHEHLTYEARPEPIRAALRGVHDRIDALVTLTEADLARWKRALSPTSIRLAVVPNPTPFPVTDPAPLLGTIVITAGRLTKQKAFDRLIDAFAPIAVLHPDWQLHIYGTGKKAGALSRQVVRLGLTGQVHLMGFTDQFEDRLREASVYAMSSRYEGFPMVLLEAMSKGVPPVSVDCPEGPRQLIRSGSNGLLVGKADVEGLSQGMLRLIEDQGLRRRLGHEAMETARTYTVGRVVDQWESLFDELVVARTLPPDSSESVGSRSPATRGLGRLGRRRRQSHAARLRTTA